MGGSSANILAVQQSSRVIAVIISFFFMVPLGVVVLPALDDVSGGVVYSFSTNEVSLHDRMLSIHNRACLHW